MIAAHSGIATMPAHDFSGKTVMQLIDLLKSEDPGIRTDAIIFLGFRYRRPGPVINPPTYNTQVPEVPMPIRVVPSLVERLKSDTNTTVRIACVDALCELKFRTNTTQVLAAGLDDTDAFVRIRACSALISISQDYSEPLIEKVITTLSQTLRPDGDIESTWYAAWIAGQLGSAGKPLIPALERTAKHKSSKVRHYANEALSKIRTKGKAN